MRHKCIVCGASLDRAARGDNPGARAQMKYCSDVCERKRLNSRYYHSHRKSIIARVIARRKEPK